mgnify:CR=1 FL=1
MLKNILTAAVLSALLGACAATGSGNAFPARADQLSARTEQAAAAVRQREAKENIIAYYDADGDAARFQHLPLLNMQFKGGGDVVAFFQRLRLAAHAGYGRSERFTGLRVRRGKQRRVKKAADAAAADAGNAPFARLLGEIVNDFQAYRTKKEPRIAVSLMLQGFKRGQRL